MLLTSVNCILTYFSTPNTFECYCAVRIATNGKTSDSSREEFYIVFSWSPDVGFVTQIHKVIASTSMNHLTTAEWGVNIPTYGVGRRSSCPDTRHEGIYGSSSINPHILIRQFLLVYLPDRSTVLNPLNFEIYNKFLLAIILTK